MAAKIASRAHAVEKNNALRNRPADIGGLARWLGVIPKYMAGGSFVPRNMRKGRSNHQT